jgi:hypothetical protein
LDKNKEKYLMAVVVDSEWLKNHGVEADGEAAEDLIDGVMDELELRSGMAIAGKLTDKQISDFEAIEDEDDRTDWLGKALPDYPKIVDQKLLEIGKEIEASSDKQTLIRSWSAE